MISKYGDTEKVRDDVKTLNEILSRQGASLLLDVISEHAGTVCNQYKLSAQDRQNIVQGYARDFNDALLERT